MVTADALGTVHLSAPTRLGEAMGKFSPDRSVLPIPDRAFGGVAGRRWLGRLPATDAAKIVDALGAAIVLEAVAEAEKAADES